MSENKTKIVLLTIVLGCWQTAFALTFSHFVGVSFRHVPFVDLCLGILLIALGLLCLSAPRFWGWIVGLLGIAMQLVPLVMWAPALSYFNDTLIGVLAIVFCFRLTKNGSSESSVNCPRGWSYNPSAWSHRIPIIALAMLCWFFARYMAAYQLGYISSIWDPFFPNGTLSVITSNVSRAFPVSDAGLGAVCYTIEFLLAWQGDQRRWASMPWLVFSFAFLVIPVGIVSIILIVLQPLIVGAWCSWCLATALCMLMMIILTAAEFVASVQFLNESMQRKQPFWVTFFKGGNEVREAPVKPLLKRSFATGVTIPWNLLVCALVGLVLVFLPNSFLLKNKLAMSDYITGPIIFAISAIAMAEVFRIFRYSLIPLGVWTLLAPFVLHKVVVSKEVVAAHCVCGLLLIILSLSKGKIKERYGAWDRLIK